jgi:Tol biopolymer transport system component
MRNILISLSMVWILSSCTDTGSTFTPSETPTLQPTKETIEVTASPSNTPAPILSKTQTIPTATEFIMQLPPGEIVFYSIGRMDGYGEGIYVMNTDGSNVRAVIENDRSYLHPSCSRDGMQISFASDLGAKFFEMDIYVMNRDGSELRQLTTSVFYEVMPSWAPDSLSLVFAVAEVPWTINVINVDGTNQRSWISRSDHLSRPSWSPDGEHIAFLSYADYDKDEKISIYHIYLAKSDGSNAHRLGEVEVTYIYLGGLAWSPDAKRIAYTGLDCKLYMVNIDGSDVTRLTDGPGCDHNPSWSSDGKFIFFDATGPDYPRAMGRKIVALDIASGNILIIRDDPGPIRNNNPSWCP